MGVSQVALETGPGRCRGGIAPLVNDDLDRRDVGDRARLGSLVTQPVSSVPCHRELLYGTVSWESWYQLQATK